MWMATVSGVVGSDRIWCALHQDSKSCQSLRYVFRVAGALALGGHPQPAIEGHLKTGQSDKSQVDVDARQKTPGVVASLTPDVSCHRASPKVAGHKHEIVREQVKSLETTKAGKNGSMAEFVGKREDNR